MKVATEFERFANCYSKYNYIQRLVAKKLISKIEYNSYSCVVDIGCGDGAIYNNLPNKIEQFIAVDISSSMLKLHPDSQHIIKLKLDFNDKALYDKLKEYNIDIVISASALQWSKDIYWSINQISQLAPHGAFAIFSDETFKDILTFLSVSSPIHSRSSIIDALISNYDIKSLEIENIKMATKSNQQILSYIKKSGVSGGRGIVEYKKIKNFLKNYNKRYIEFQVIYFVGKSKNFKNLP